MAGLNKNSPIPTEIKLHKKSRQLEIAFDDGKTFTLSHELLRISSPSAAVRGHGPGQETLQTGKRNVEIASIEPVGNYAVKLCFSDGHDSGIYSWDLFYTLGTHQNEIWQSYLAKLDAAGANRDVDTTSPPPQSGGGCGHH